VRKDIAPLEQALAKSLDEYRLMDNLRPFETWQYHRNQRKMLEIQSSSYPLPLLLSFHSKINDTSKQG